MLARRALPAIEISDAFDWSCCRTKTAFPVGRTVGARAAMMKMFRPAVGCSIKASPENDIAKGPRVRSGGAAVATVTPASTAPGASITSCVIADCVPTTMSTAGELNPGALMVTR